MTDFDRWIDASPLEGWAAFSSLTPTILDVPRAFTNEAIARFIARLFDLKHFDPVDAAPMNNIFRGETWGHDLQKPFNGPFHVEWGGRHLRLGEERGVKRIDAQFTEEEGRGGSATTFYRIYDKASDLAIVLEAGYLRLAVAASPEAIERVRTVAEKALQYATWHAQIDCDLERIGKELMPTLQALLKKLDPESPLQNLALTLHSDDGRVEVDIDPDRRLLRAEVHGLHSEVRGTEAFLKQHLGLQPAADLEASIKEMRALFAQGKTQASRMAKDILAAFPDQPDARMIRAIALVEPSMLDGLDADSYELAVVRGFLAEFEHHYDEAIAHWEEALRLRPQDPVAGVHLGKLLWTKRQPPDHKRIRRLLQLGLDHPEPPNRLDLRPPNRARSTKRTAEYYLPAVLTVWAATLRALFAQGDAGAPGMAEDILADVPDQPDAQLILAILHDQPERLDGIDADPYDVAVARGFLAERAQQYEDAIAQWEQAHRLRPDDPVAGVHLGTLLWTQRTPPEPERAIPLLLLGIDHPEPPNRLDVHPPDQALNLKHAAEAHLHEIDAARRG